MDSRLGASVNQNEKFDKELFSRKQSSRGGVIE